MLPLSLSSAPAAPTTTSLTPAAFLDRRAETSSRPDDERRQFGSSHTGLSPAGRELAVAIDQYKLQHRRRYITCDEMLIVLTSLGYQRSGE